jgi:hypothetical protein
MLRRGHGRLRPVPLPEAYRDCMSRPIDPDAIGRGFCTGRPAHTSFGVLIRPLEEGRVDQLIVR